MAVAAGIIIADGNIDNTSRFWVYINDQCANPWGCGVGVGLMNPVLMVTKNGNGTVTSSPLGIQCGIDCVEAYTPNTSVTLTAADAPDATFTGWSGCDIVNGNQCTVTMTASKTVAANYATTTYTLTINKRGSAASIGTVTSDDPAQIINCGMVCSAAFPAGAKVTLTAALSPDYIFKGWSGTCAGEEPCTVKMTKDISVNALFVKENAKNRSFELYLSASKIPNNWNVSSNLSKVDGKNAYALAGVSSFGFINTTAVTKTLTQPLSPLNGKAGDPVIFSFGVKGYNIPTTPGVCQGQAMLYNGSTLVMSKIPELSIWHV